MNHVKNFKTFLNEYNTHVVADTSTMNNIPVVDYVDLDYFGTDIEMDEKDSLKSPKEKEPYNKTGRDDREILGRKEPVMKISVS
jgi:hypothetical protein